MTIYILGKPYEVEYLDDMMMQQMQGYAQRGAGRIAINSTTAPDQQADTLLHEILHIIDKELVLDLNEATIARLAVGLHSAGYVRKEEAHG